MTPPLVRRSLRGAVIVIDPGHNGANSSHTQEINRLVDAGGFRKACNTTGTAGGDFTETEFNWELARAVRSRLERLGARVVLTRPSNSGWGPCIDERGLIASRSHALLLLSLHADGAPSAAHGFHVIHPSPIVGFTTATSGPSAVLATSVRDALVATGFTPATYVGRQGLIERGDLGTLNRAGVPAVMVECGNMRDAADLATLRSAAGRSRLADALVQGLVSWTA